MKKLLLAIAVVAMAAGCAKVDEGSVPFGKNTLRVTSDEATRTEIVTDDDVTFRHNWAAGDAIALFDARDILKYELVGEGGSTVADFTGEAPVKQPAPFYAIYPYKDNIDIYNDATNQSKFLYDYPAEIEYDAAKTMQGSNVMIGFTDGKSLNMKNACSYLRLSISTPNMGFLNSIEVIARGGEALAGPHLIGIDTDGVPFTEVYDAAECSDRVVVKFAETQFVMANSSVFYIPLPAVELSDGLAFVFNGDFGGEPSINLTSSTATLERNTVLLMPDYRVPSEEAKIGDVVYETVTEAFAVANASDEDVTVTLLRSCVAGAKLPLNNKVGHGYVTLNLNGKTLTLTDTLVLDSRKLIVTDNFSDDPAKQGTIKFNYTGSSTAHYAVYTKNGADIQWQKGNLDITGCRGIYLTTDATGTISGGTITTRGYICVGVGSTGKKLVVDGDVTMNAGTNNAIYLWGGEAEVMDGHYKNGSGSLVYVSGATAKATVSGGYFDAYAANPVSASTGGAVAYVTGGCFNKAIFTIYAVDPDGNVYLNDLNPDPESNEVYPFMVVPKTDEPVAHGARTSGTPYWDFASVESAFLSASTTAGANTLTLLQDADASATLTLNNTYATTIDFNGKNVASSASPALTVGNKANVTILDSSAEGTGELSTTGATALEVAGTVSFNGGSLAAADKAIAVNGGKLTVLNGWFSGGTSDIAGTGNIKLSSGYFKNKPDAAMIEEDNAAMPLSPAESHNGRDYNWLIKRGYTVLVPGIDFNTAIKSLANNTTVTAATYLDNAITKIVFKVDQDLTSVTGTDVSALQDGSIIASFDGGVVTVSTNYPSLRSGEAINSMFRDLRSCTAIEGFELVDTRDATAANQMFYRSMKLETVNISKMKTGKITNMRSLFYGTPSLKQEVFDFSKWDTSSSADMAYMFDSTGAKILDLTSFDTSKDTIMSYMFAYCTNLEEVKLSSFNTSNVKSMNNMFWVCNNLLSLDVTSFNTSKVTGMLSMFNGCSKIETLDVSNFNTANVNTMSYMFYNCEKLKALDLKNFNTAAVTNMSYMFSNCYAMETVDVSSFNTAKVTTMDNMFEDCQKITSLDLSHFRTPNVKYFRSMFNRCYELKSVDLSNAVCDATYPGASSSNGSAFCYMFYACRSLESIDLRNFVYPGRSSYVQMFDGCVNLKELHLDKFGNIGTFNYINYYNYVVGNPTTTTCMAANATAENPCRIYSDEAVLIRMLMFNRSHTSGSNTYYNFGTSFRNNMVKTGRVVFHKTGFTNPWTFDPAYDYSAAPELTQIIAPTE